MDRGLGLLAVLALFLLEYGLLLILGRDPPRGPIRRRLSGVAGLGGEELMPELGVLLVRVEQCVRLIRLDDLADSNGIC